MARLTGGLVAALLLAPTLALAQASGTTPRAGGVGSGLGAPPPHTGSTTSGTSSSTARSQATTGSMVNINSASATQLDSLPGIGKSRADAIIKNRPYKSTDDLVNRHIIPQSVYNNIKGRIVAGQG